MNTTKEILITARKLITDENNWTQGAYARDESGEDVPDYDPTAICFCSIGAVSKACRINYTNQFFGSFCRDVLDALAKECEVECEDDQSIAKFNDNATHQEVLALFDKAIANCN